MAGATSLPFVLGQLVRRQMRRRYRAHVFGPVWPFLNPLALLAIYTLVFSVFIGVPTGVNDDWKVGPGWGGHLRFALIAYAGLLPFLFFTDVLAGSSVLVRQSPQYVRKMVFPLDLLAPVHVAALLPEMLVGFGFLVAIDTAASGLPGPELLLLPLAILPLILFALAAAWLLSAVAVYVPDVSELMGMFLRVYFFLTPVVYPLEVVPEPWRTALSLNPLASILNGIRNVALFGHPLVWPSWLLTVGVGGLAAAGSYLLFQRLRKGFADAL